MNFLIKLLFLSILIIFTSYKNSFSQTVNEIKILVNQRIPDETIMMFSNSSILDNLHGEIYRSIIKKKHHYSIFDFYKWNENEVEEILKLYNWEKSPDTKSTWRIGDGAAAFYNYIYYTMAGFSEHDTFRSNQIREGDITRKKALQLIEIDNIPRAQNIKWFLQILNLDFENTINTINKSRLRF